MNVTSRPKIVKVEWAGYSASRTSLDLPFSRELARIMTAAGHESVLLPTTGCSLPKDLPAFFSGLESTKN